MLVLIPRPEVEKSDLMCEPLNLERFLFTAAEVQVHSPAESEVASIVCRSERENVVGEPL